MASSNIVWRKGEYNMEKHKYYLVKSLKLAQAIQFIGGMKYFKFDDREDPSIKVYSFENTEKFQKILNELLSMQSKYK